MVTLDLVLKSRLDYVTNMLQFCRERVHLWQQVPFLALQADGRTGFSDSYAVAYRRGLWRLDSTMHDGYYSFVVDCTDGEIKTFGGHFPNADELAGIDPLDLDVETIIEELKEQALRPKSSYMDHVEPDWRDEYKVPNPYTRKEFPKF